MKTRKGLTPKQTPSVKLRTTVIYVTVSVLLASVVGWHLFIYINTGIVEDSKAAGSTYNSAQTGNWSTGSTWNGGSAPPATLNGDNITVRSNHTVTVPGTLTAKNNVSITIRPNGVLRINSNLVVQNNLVLVVEGDLIVTGNIDIDNGATISINGGGELTAGGDVSIGNNGNFTVDGTVNIGGDLTMGNNGNFSGNGDVNIIGNGCSLWKGPGTCQDNVTLPIELINFSATVEASRTVILSWQTATELNNDYFTIERSSDGIHYDSIAFVKGSGTTTAVTKYSYDDQYPLEGLAYYRLTQTDYDGTSKSFNPVSLTISASLKSTMKVYPNPLTSSTLNVDLPKSEEGVIEVLNARGDVILSKAITEPSEHVTLEFDATMQEGLYYVNYKTSTVAETVKLVKAN